MISKQTKIHCHAFPAFGHSIPMLRVAEILQSRNPDAEIIFLTSAFFVERIKHEYPTVTMQPIEDGLTFQKFREQIKVYGPKVLSHFVFLMHQKYFKEKKDHPDLIICDLFSLQGMKYATKHNIKCLINSIGSYGSIQEIFNFPTFRQSFGIGGFTVCYPTLFNPHQLFLGTQNLQAAFRYKYPIMTSSAIGFEKPDILPSHHIFTGFLPTRSTKITKYDDKLLEWMSGWKEKGKKKFLYVCFGTQIGLSQQLTLKVFKAIQMTGYPTIWSLKDDLNGKISSPLIFHSRWLKQQSILSLQQVQCFISHCGWGSTQEAVVSGTSVIGIPAFGDQFYNASLIHTHKVGLRLIDGYPMGGPPPAFNPKITLEEFTSAIQQVMQTPSFHENMSKISKRCKAMKTQEIINDTVFNILQHGSEHLIDQNYEKATERSTVTTFKLILLLILVVVVWSYRKKLGKMFQ